MLDQPVAPRAVLLANRLRGLSSVAQPILMIGLFVLWRFAHIPFWKAAEYCFGTGLFIYVVLRALSAVLLTLARVQPAALLATPVTRFVSVMIFVALRYLYAVGFVKSLAALAALYLGSAVIAHRLRRRSAHYFPT